MIKKTLLETISSVKFVQKNVGSDCEHIPFKHVRPRLLETFHLTLKVRYHMKQMLACLLELKKRELDVCSLLSNKLVEYKTCKIKNTENSLKMFVNIEGEKCIIQKNKC